MAKEAMSKQESAGLIDYEILGRVHSEITEEEAKAAYDVDEIEYELLKHKLFNILAEGKENMERIASSPVVRDAGECMFCILTKKGDLALSASGIYWHTIGTGWAVKFILKHWMDDQSVGVYLGDQFFNNDTFYGGAHPPDQAIAAPIFFEGEDPHKDIIGWAGALTHTAETGAVEPGGMPPSAKDKYAEGIRIPCVKIVERGLLKNDLMLWVDSAIRDPRLFELDTRSKIAGNNYIKRRVQEIAKRYGRDFFERALNRMIIDSEKRCREKVEHYMDGVYRNVGWSDNIGGGKHGLFKYACTMKKSGRDLEFDFTGTSPHQPSPFNVTPAAACGVFFGITLQQLYWDTDWNMGILDSVKMNIPRDCMLWAKEDSAITMGNVAAIQLMEICRKAISLMQYASANQEDVMAGWGGCWRSSFWGGPSQYGETRANFCLDNMAMGLGALADRDGVNSGAANFAPDSNCADVESWEAEAPLLYLSRNHITDSGGYGKFQGGASFGDLVMLHNTSDQQIGFQGLGSACHMTPGVAGGYPPIVAPNWMFQDTDVYEKGKKGEDLPTKIEEVQRLLNCKQVEHTAASSSAREFKPGDIFYYAMNAGAGYGDPLKRDPEMVMESIRNVLTSHWVAKNVYCVAYDEKTLRVDKEATETRRKEELKRRLKEAIPAQEYIKKNCWPHVDRKPPAEWLTTHGPWPTAEGNEL